MNDPDGYWQRKASDLDVPEKIVELVGMLPYENKKELLQLLQLVDNPMLGLTWLGPMKRIQDLSPVQREKMLQKWSKSSVPLLRKAFNDVKRLTGVIFFGDMQEGKKNPNWKKMGYPGPIETPPPVLDKYLSPLTIDKDQKLDCDVVIVGSGGGGGVVAGILAKKGKKVIVVEKGPYLKNTEMNRQEVDMLQQLYERKGALASKDGGMTILAGSCVGGGTTVNWAGSFRTPDYVLEEWASHGNAHFTDKAYRKYFDDITERLSINTKLSKHNPQNQALWDGAKGMNYKVKLIPRNVKGCDHDGGENGYCTKCGYGTLGDAYAHKQCMPITYLQDAQDNGAEILANTEVTRVDVKNGMAKGVWAVHTDREGRRYNVFVKAPKVVIAGGAVHTPVILKKSGLTHPHIGRNLFLHPVMGITGKYKHKIEGWYGPMMSAVCDEFNRLDGRYGVKIETAPVHCGLAALCIPWQSGEQYKQEMLDSAHLASFIVLCRDKIGGRVTLGKENDPVVTYNLSHYDRKHLLRGLAESIKMHQAAGATAIRPLHNDNPFFYPASGKDINAFIDKTMRRKWVSNRFGLFSAHQMGTCRMGGEEKRYPVKPTGETYEVRNLFVADGSLFPAASGVNPMMSIQALAAYVADNI